MLGLKIFVRVQKFSAEALRAFAQLLPPWSLYAQIIANMSHYSAHYNRYHSFSVRIFHCMEEETIVHNDTKEEPINIHTFKCYCCVGRSLVLHITRHPYSEKDSFGGNVHHTRNQKATIKVKIFSDSV